MDDNQDDSPGHALDVLLNVIETDKYGHDIHLDGADEDSYEPVLSVGGSNSSWTAGAKRGGESLLGTGE